MSCDYVIWQRRLIDSETVILTGDHHLARLEILHRMVRAMVPKFHLLGLRPRRQRQQLMSKANAEQRNARLKERLNRVDRIVTRLGIRARLTEIFRPA